MRFNRQREDHAFAFESANVLEATSNPKLWYETVECWTVYADSNQVTHSVRLWVGLDK